MTRKITRGATRIKLGLQEKLYLGNLGAQRDWGFAGDYVEGMWPMLQQDKPDDYVVAMNELYSVREFCEKTFSRIDLDYQDFVEVDPRYSRPSEVDLLLGDSVPLRNGKGWTPTRTNLLVFQEYCGRTGNGPTPSIDAQRWAFAPESLELIVRDMIAVGLAQLGSNRAR